MYFRKIKVTKNLMPMHIHKFTLVLIVSIFILVCTNGAKSQSIEKPNIVFVLIDDLGWMDLSCQGSNIYETPNIDSLAKQSMVFSNAYAAHPRCVPSRYGIMTGNYPAKGGVPAKKIHLNANDETFAKFLKPAGYTSCYIGKWHLGDGENNPKGKGFDVSIAAGNAGSPRQYIAPYNNHDNKPWKINKTPIPDVDDSIEGEYLNDRLSSNAIEFIDKNKDKPFFLMMAHYAVHEPLQAPQELIDKYKKKIASASFTQESDYIKEGTGRTKMKQDNAIYAAMLENLDDNIGRLIGFLNENNLSENTVIVFTSDHGGLSNDGLNERFLATSNLPLRAGKGWLYEGGIRVPLFVKWPGVTKAVKNDHIITGIDFYPTFAEMVSGKKVKSNGISIVELLKGADIKQRKPIFWYSPKGRPKNTGDSNSIAVRHGDFKLIEWYETGRAELYNLKDDIGEQNDLTYEMPDKEKEMLEYIRNWKIEMGIK